MVQFGRADYAMSIGLAGLLLTRSMAVTPFLVGADPKRS